MRAKEFWAGLIFLAIGIAAVVGALQYRIGTPTQMGPGYFPMLIGAVLALLGALAMIQGLRDAAPAPIGAWPIVPLLFVIAGVIAFAALIERAGLVPALAALTLLGCYGRLRRHGVEVLLIFVAVASLSVGIFIIGLRLPLRVW